MCSSLSLSLCSKNIVLKILIHITYVFLFTNGKWSKRSYALIFFFHNATKFQIPLKWWSIIFKFSPYLLHLQFSSKKRLLIKPIMAIYPRISVLPPPTLISSAERSVMISTLVPIDLKEVDDSSHLWVDNWQICLEWIYLDSWPSWPSFH